MELQTMPLRFRVWDKEFRRMAATDLDIPALVRFLRKDYQFDDEYPQYEFSQDTGLKDENGTEIFFGDILFNGRWHVEVKYKDGEVIGHNHAEDIYCGDLHNMQLRGNIWQNSDLLK